MSDTQDSVELLPVLSLLAAAVIAGPIFKRLGFGSVLGYLVAGMVVGPFGLRVLTDPTTILHLAELGVVLFLFIIGLEMRPIRLWELRKQIFGLRLVQVVCCTLALTWISMATGSKWLPAIIVGAGFVLTSTAIVIQILEERREISSPGGQRIVPIRLLEVLCIVPLLAVVGFLSQVAGGAGKAFFSGRSLIGQEAQGGTAH